MYFVSMSVKEIEAEISKLTPEELKHLWSAIEDELDRVAADEALHRNDFENWDKVKARLA
jgi:hypothetical protein